MNIDTLKDIVKVAKEQGVAELKVEGKDYKVTVSFATAASQNLHSHQPMIHYQAQSPMPAPVPQAAATPIPVTPASKALAVETGLHVIKSPFVGTFYTSASPGKPVYTKLGEKVKVGQPLCVLEAMKIMNEIDADVAGEIVEICVDNESLVEFGQPLFKIKPS